MGQFKKLLVEALTKEGYQVQSYDSDRTRYYCQNPEYALTITRLQLCIHLNGNLRGALFRTGRKENFVKEAMIFVRFYAGPPTQKNEEIK